MDIGKIFEDAGYDIFNIFRLGSKDDFKDPLLSELVFEKYDFNHDDNLSKEECDEVKELIISASFIQDLKGIEHFVNLEKLVLNTHNLKN